jgi:hypothetical protein
MVMGILQSACQFMQKRQWGLYKDCIKSIDQFVHHYHLNLIKSSSM